MWRWCGRVWNDLWWHFPLFLNIFSRGIIWHLTTVNTATETFTLRVPWMIIYKLSRTLSVCRQTLLQFHLISLYHFHFLDSIHSIQMTLVFLKQLLLLLLRTVPHWWYHLLVSGLWTTTKLINRSIGFHSLDGLFEPIKRFFMLSFNTCFLFFHFWLFKIL